MLIIIKNVLKLDLILLLLLFQLIKIYLEYGNLLYSEQKLEKDAKMGIKNFK